jgi:citrate synthase
VLDMLDAIGSAETGVSRWLPRGAGAGRRIMGMGHRIYRVRDPRAAVFERGPSASSRRREHARVHWRAPSRAAEELLAARHPERPLRANVEFYTAVLLEAVGLPRELFTRPLPSAASPAGARTSRSSEGRAS